LFETISGQLIITASVIAGVYAFYYLGRFLTKLEISFVGKKFSDYSEREEKSWLNSARQKYSVALADLVTSPLDENVLKRALECGRHYSQICSEQGNAILFNELTLQKDVNTARQTNEAI
jgi:hypothetical protein